MGDRISFSEDGMVGRAYSNYGISDQNVLVCKTDDKGKTWSEPFESSLEQVGYPVYVVDALKVFMFIYVGGGNDIFISSYDGGVTFGEERFGIDGEILDICFLDDLHGYLISSNTTDLNGPICDVYYTEDGANTWERINQSLINADHIHFRNLRVGVAFSDYGVVNITNDFGRTWRLISL